jgi:hypothetical protein
MSLTLIRSAAGAALFAVLAAGCGTAVTAQQAAAKPAAAHPHQSAPMHAVGTMPPALPTTTAPAAPATAPDSPSNPIPQGNGGDQDPDNNGGPSDGDSNI